MQTSLTDIHLHGNSLPSTTRRVPHTPEFPVESRGFRTLDAPFLKKAHTVLSPRTNPHLARFSRDVGYHEPRPCCTYRLDLKGLASLAREALIAEAELTPKPGLVDRRGSGAHHDLSLALMRQSATAIEPYFAAMASCSQGRTSTAICDRSWQPSAAMRNAPCTRPRREATPTRAQSGFSVFWSRRRYACPARMLAR